MQDDKELEQAEPSVAENTQDTAVLVPETSGETTSLDADEIAIEFADFLEFDTMELHPTLLARIKEIGWATPTPIQRLCLPITLKGRDAAGFAQTGTGKTGVFLITMADKLLKLQQRTKKTADGINVPFGVVLVPTRELAIQITSDANALFGELLGVSSVAVYGGEDYEGQIRQLNKGADIVIATPGRLRDFYQKKVLTLAESSVFVCDEADRMFDMGFIEDVEFFFDILRPEAQRLLFSATTNEKVKELAFEYLENPKYLSANPEELTPHNVEQVAIICEAIQKVKVMLGLLRDDNPTCAIIFTNTKMVAEWLQYKLFHNGIDAEAITGDLPQKKRQSIIQRIKKSELKVLIATDVASRGLHIASVTHVYNFDLPDEATNYIHRIGRTARAGASGKAISLVCEDYGQNLEPIRQLLGENIPIVVQWHDDSHLAIEDLSGNPYEDPTFSGHASARASRFHDGDRNKGGRRPYGDRDGASSDRGPRGPRSGRDGARGGRDEPRRDRPDRGPDRGRDGGRGPRPQDSRPEARGGYRSDNKDAAGRPGARRDWDNNRTRGPQQGQGKGRYPQKQGDQRRRDQQPHTTAAVKKPVAAGPSTIMGMLRKIISVIFGFGKKK